MYGGLCNSDYVKSLLDLKETLIKNYHSFNFISLTNESLIQRGRNTLAWYFLNNSNSTHLLFIDGDIGFNPEDVLKMLAADKSLIGGIYPKKQINWEDATLAIQTNKNLDIESFTGKFVLNMDTVPERVFFDQPIEVKHIGTGFMLIKRHVFEDLREHVGFYIGNGNTEENGQPVYNYFQVTVDEVDNVLLSEDYFFCKAYQKIGGKVYAAPWCNFFHSGTYRFRGSYVEQLKLRDGSFFK